MKKIKKLLLTLVLMLFIPIIIAGCGENGITKITPEAGSLLTSWEVGTPYDYSTMKLKVVYEDGTTKTITPDTEGVQIVNIDTTTSGEKKLKIIFEGFEKEITITVYDSVSQSYDIQGFNPPAFVADYNANKAVNSAEDGGFLVNDDKYYVGDDNEFKFLPHIIAFNGDIPQILNKYKSNVKVEMKNGSQYVELTANTTPTLASMVAVDNENSTFDFTQDAVGNTFKITVRPYYDETITPITFEFMVKDGYNVYNAHDLSVLDNNPNTNASHVWGDLKEDWGIPSASEYSPKGIYLHGDITLTPADFPETFFINEEEAGENTDNALGTLKQRTSLYTFSSARDAEEFEFCGNYFTIDASGIPLTVRDCYDKSGRTEYYRDVYTNQLLALQGHAALFSFGGDNTQYITNWTQEQQFVGPVKVKNTSFIGNAPKNNNAAKKETGGIYMFMTGASTLTTENIISQQFVIATNALGCWEADTVLATMLRSDDNDTNNVTTNRNHVVIKDSKYMDAYTTMFYSWGGDIEVYDSILKDAGGPLFMAVHHGDDNNSQFSTIDIYDSFTESYVTGSEAWFSAYNATDKATAILQAGAAIRGNASAMEIALDKTFEKNSMTKNIDSYNKFNFIGLLMQADMAPNKTETRGCINLYETEGTEAVLVGSINAFTTGDNINEQYKKYGSDPLLEMTINAPLFQSVVDGELSTMSSIVDNEGTMGIYGQSFADCLANTEAVQYFGIDGEADITNMFSGDYLTVFVNESSTRINRMAMLVEYHRVDN